LSSSYRQDKRVIPDKWGNVLITYNKLIWYRGKKRRESGRRKDLDIVENR